MKNNRTAGKGLDLDIQQNDRFQRNEWRFERAGWLFLAMFILAGLLGVLGPGPLSKTTVESEAGTIQVEYQRVTHNEADDSLTLLFSENAIENGKVTAELTGTWVEGVELSAITPQPTTQYAIPGGIALEFDVRKQGDVEIAFTFRPMDYWMIDAEVTVGRDSVAFSQLVLP